RKGPSPSRTSAMKKLSAHSASSERSMAFFVPTNAPMDLPWRSVPRSTTQSAPPSSGQCRSQRSAKNKERAGCNQNKADGVIPGDRLLEIENGEACEHQQRDDLLNGLELSGGVDRTAPSVGRHCHAVLHERDQPAHHDDADERRLLEAQVPIPGQ